MFYFGVLIALALIALLFFSAPLIARFYEEPKLLWLTRVMSLNFLFGSLMTVHNTLLIKRIQFRKKVLSNFLSFPISAAVGIGMALKDFGPWSLVGMQLSASFSRMVFIWILFPWRPQLRFSFRSLKEMFPYGSRILAASLVSIFFDNIYLVLIGKMYNKTELGYYTRAHRMHELFAVVLTQTVGQVMFPAFSAVQDDQERFLRGARKATSFCLFVIAPILMGLLMTSDSFVGVVFGRKWLPAAPFLRVLCVAGLFYPLNYINNNILQAKGYSNLFFRQEVIKRALQIINIFVAFRFGVIALLVGHTICCAAGWLVSVYYMRSVFIYNFSMQLRDAAPYLALSAAMMAGVAFVRVIAEGHMQIGIFALQVVVGVAIYAAGIFLFKPAAYRECCALAGSAYRKWRAGPQAQA